ncbi:hypothetical protein LOC67_25210 [Stieleria sp. JC731]|uniref:hypothetical protein n=1 Tax=Pirellulaceae TaxID=2691357 RepID=UPI001E432C94|nr:hypothetical protein [Stieleria sp. JC731]MCC9603864.1 hypothetical protein [Stieleria sp. JC731]
MRHFSFLIAIAGFLLPATLVSSQDYALVEPSGVVTSDVYIRGNRLVAVERNGSSYYFRRDRSLDSINGRYVGYWLASMNRIVRFPRSGYGPMQVADLDDAFPQFVFSRRQLRPHRGGAPARPLYDPYHAFYAPGYFGPWGYPSYGYINSGLSLNVYPGSGFGFPGYHHQSTVVRSTVVPRAPLPPVTLNLVNTAQREVRVTISDRGSSSAAKQVRIAPGQQVPVEFQRDAGADRVQEIESYAADGSIVHRTVSIPIPPSPRYELVVHEWRLQSVAIDRTGKSPNPIEETNFQGRGLGRFQLPPGDQLSAGTLDVVRAAMAADNAGAVTPLIDDQNSTPLRPVSPLEQMILRQQNR